MIRYLFITALFISNFSYANSIAYECSKISSDKERLSCYDEIFKEVDQVTPISSAEEKIAVVKTVEKKTEINEPKVNKKISKNDDNFGLSYQQIKKAQKIEDSEAIRSRIIRVTKQVSRKITFRLENGQVWKSESALGANKAAQFKKGTDVELVKSRMGGYSMVNAKTNARIKINRVK